jgi:hypothetical protein
VDVACCVLVDATVTTDLVVVVALTLAIEEVVTPNVEVTGKVVASGIVVLITDVVCPVVVISVNVDNVVDAAVVGRAVVVVGSGHPSYRVPEIDPLLKQVPDVKPDSDATPEQSAEV